MSAPDRRIRHLRLSASTAADVRHVLPRLEDALRCASLPDAGGQLLLVRRLALGRLPRDASAQSLSLLIERRVADLAGNWLDGDEAAAATADCVRFSSRYDARLRLSLRLARGQATGEWYWPLAVPEFRPAAPAAANLCGIAAALAALPEARIALPAWTAALVEAGAVPLLVAAIAPVLGAALTARAGLAGPAATARPGGTAATSRSTWPDIPAPAWLAVLLAAAAVQGDRRIGVSGDVAAGPTADAPPAGLAGEVPARARKPVTTPRAGTTAGLPSGPVDAPILDTASHPAEAPRGAPAGLATTAEAPVFPAPAGMAPAPAPASISGKAPPPWPATRNPLEAPPWLAPSAGGGLLFLLPLLARLGIAEWCAAHGRAGEDFARRVLELAAHRMHLPEGDPIRLAPPPPGRKRPPPVPAAWSSPLLAPPRSCQGEGSLAVRLARARDLDDQAAVWLTAARRWLRRGGHIGLASLVLRPARVAVTATHMDVHFRLSDADLRIRRAGLDLDPGWLPWFGRVVAFHYQSAEAVW